MGEGFKKLKRKFLIDAIIKALIVFTSAALLVIATFLIVISRGVFDFNILYAILIGVAFGLLLGLVTFFAFKLGDKRLSKKLDRLLGLNEKVQTMHDFQGSDEEIAELQRQQTQAILETTPVKTSSFLKGLIVFIAVGVLAVSYFVVSLVMYIRYEPVTDEPKDPSQGEEKPPEGDDPPNEEIPFEPTLHHKKELEELIQYVVDSALQADAKAEVIDELELLLASLDTFETESEMKEYVIGVIKRVREKINLVNSTYSFYMTAKDCGNDKLEKLSLSLYSLNLTAIENEINTLYSTLLLDENGNIKTTEYLEELKDELDALNNALTVVLENSGLDETHTLYTMMKSLSAVFTDVINTSKSMTNAARKLDTALRTDLINGLKQSIPQEKSNEDVKLYVVAELMRIFGITAEDLNDVSDGKDNVEAEDPEERPELGDDGGFGTGNTLFGSDDVVIDPESNATSVEDIYVQYGEIIGRYNARINELINSGELTEEQAAILDEYFTVLLTPKEK